jgi:hypothetical protein
MVPWRLRYQNLLAGFGHVSLRKVRVMLLVDRETRLDKTQNENSFFCRRCPYVVCAQNRLELTTWSINRSLFGEAQMIGYDKLHVTYPGFSSDMYGLSGTILYQCITIVRSYLSAYNNCRVDRLQNSRTSFGWGVAQDVIEKYAIFLANM